MHRVLVLLLIAAAAAAEPRPIESYEREAVGVVAEFLSRGPDALYDRLAPDAPLHALSREDALAELAARVGPADGAKWTLQTIVRGQPGDVAFRVEYPSGYEDGLLLRMKNGALFEIVTLAEDPVQRATLPPLPAPEPRDDKFLIAAAFLGAIAAMTAKRSRIFAGIALIAAGLSIAGAFHKLKNPFTKEAKVLAFTELRALASLRTALARGGALHTPNDLSPAARDVATLWILQSGAPLKTNIPAGTAPLASIIRARLALTNGKPAQAATAYTQALDVEPLRDDIAYEAATSFGVAANALPFLHDQRFDSSRGARLHYARAMRAVGDGDLANGRKHFYAAWALEPLTREELVREPRLFPLLSDVGVQSKVAFHASAEPLVRSARLGRSPMTLPNDAQTFVSGEAMSIALKRGTMHVPGGAVLAPANARVIAATFGQKEEDAAALHDALALVAAKDTLHSTREAQALADHNRWAELVKLTDDLTPKTTTIDPALLVLRLRALLRTQRVGDAVALANGAAVRELKSRKTFPATLLSIADAMASSGSWDTAETLYGEIEAEEQKPIVEARLKQIESRRAIATDGATIDTPHFVVRHDAAINPAIASRIGDLLEAELVRVRQRLGVPNADPGRVTVNVLSWDDFRGSITGVDHIVGLYDGEILFPFAAVNQFKPELVAIITHELTHAVVAEATQDNAPRWFQEGIAERMELVPQHENAFRVTPPQLILPLPLLDAVMANATDPQMGEEAYRVAQTFIRFLEARYANAIPKLIAAFAKGMNTDEALTALTGKPVETLDAEFREWGFANNGLFANTERFPYEELYSPGVDPRIKAGFKWSRRP